MNKTFINCQLTRLLSDCNCQRVWIDGLTDHTIKMKTSPIFLGIECLRNFSVEMEVHKVATWTATTFRSVAKKDFLAANVRQADWIRTAADSRILDRSASNCDSCCLAANPRHAFWIQFYESASAGFTGREKYSCRSKSHPYYIEPGWEDWAKIRPMGDCLHKLGNVLKITEVAYIFVLLYPQVLIVL
jgi:hypothetical protein